MTIKVGDKIRAEGWNDWFEVKGIRGDVVYLYTTNKKMLFAYTISDHEWEVLPNTPLTDKFQEEGW